MEENNDVLSDSSSELSNEPEQQPAESSEQAPVEQEASPKESPEDKVPFHLHPRFQEVIFQKNQLAEQNKDIQRQLAQLQNQFSQNRPQEQAKKDELIERLKGIDPEFGKRFEEMNGLKSEIAEFKQWQQQMAAEKSQMEISSTKEKLFSENNIPAERRSIYEAMIRDVAQKDPSLQISDLPKVFKTVHDSIGKLFSDIQRQTTKDYVQTKSASASKPSTQPKGQSVKNNGTMEFSKNPQEAKSQLIAEVLKQSRASKDI